MPLISFLKNHTPLDVPRGANLMKALLDAGIPVASSCAGEGVCAKCKVTILKGSENLSAESDLERFLKNKFKLPKEMRVSCQTQIFGDISIDTSYW